MGGVAFNDVASPTFWVFALVAVLCLALAERGDRFKWTLAALNLGFLALMVGVGPAGLLLLSATVLHGAGRPGPSWQRWAFVTAAGTLVMSAFLVHKLPVLPQAWGPAKSVFVAVGMSYVVLRAVEYLRAGIEGHTAQVSLIDTVNYLFPFHMLAAGPVMAFSDFQRQPVPAPALDREAALQAFERIAAGLFKKFVLADGLIQTMFLTDFKAEGAYWILEVQMYYLYIYLDFSAYSDIAVGLGRLLGVATPENFNRPLAARNIVVFWERWHMSLSQFIRRNLFIPLQLMGMRWTQGKRPRLVASLAFAVSFMLCGLWHGISWRFLIWGAGHALALIACHLYRDALIRRLGRKGAAAFSERPAVRALATVLTFEFVALSLEFLAHPATAFLG